MAVWRAEQGRDKSDWLLLGVHECWRAVGRACLGKVRENCLVIDLQ